MVLGVAESVSDTGPTSDNLKKAVLKPHIFIALKISESTLKMDHFPSRGKTKIHTTFIVCFTKSTPLEQGGVMKHDDIIIP